MSFVGGSQRHKGTKKLLSLAHNPLNFPLCPLNVCRAATNGAKPAKSIQPKNRPNAKAVQFTHPVTGKSPRKAKRNREPPDYPGNSLSLPCLFTHVSPTRYFDRRARETGCGFLSPVVRIPRPDFGGQFRPILAHIIVHVQFAVKAGFQLILRHCQRVQFNASRVQLFPDVPM